MTQSDKPVLTVKQKRILIVKLSAVGDIVHTLPALQTLRNVFPDAYISWAVHKGPSGLLQNNPLLDEVICIPRQLKTFKAFCDVIHSLRKPKFDIAIDFQGLSKSGMWSFFSGAKQRIGFSGKESREINSLFMTRRILIPQATMNIIDINLSLLSALEISSNQLCKKATLFPSNEDQQYVQKWGQQARLEPHKAFVIDPFAGWVTKTWTFEYWAEFCDKLYKQKQYSVILLWGPSEENHVLALKEQINSQNPNICPVIAPKTSLLQLAALIKLYALAFIGGDTGPMHIAASLNIPVIALFGASSSDRNAPAFDGAKYITIHDLSQPCAGTFDRHCKHGHAPHHCMATLTPDSVLQQTTRFLENL